MFSLPKLAVLAIIIGVIWYGFKFFSRSQQVSNNNQNNNADSQSTPPPGSAVDMVQCTVCDDFVAAKGATTCGKDNCPYPGA